MCSKKYLSKTLSGTGYIEARSSRNLLFYLKRFLLLSVPSSPKPSFSAVLPLILQELPVLRFSEPVSYLTMQRDTI